MNISGRVQTWAMVALMVAGMVLAGCQSGQRLVSSAVGEVQKAASRITGGDTGEARASKPAAPPKPAAPKSDQPAELAGYHVPPAPAPSTRLAGPSAAAPPVATAPAGAVPAGRVGVLVRALGDPDPQLRREAAEMLGQMGPAARESEPALQKARQDDNDPAVRAAAGEALKRIGGS